MPVSWSRRRSAGESRRTRAGNARSPSVPAGDGQLLGGKARESGSDTRAVLGSAPSNSTAPWPENNEVGLLGATAVMADATRLAHPVEQAWLRRTRRAGLPNSE